MVVNEGSNRLQVMIIDNILVLKFSFACPMYRFYKRASEKSLNPFQLVLEQLKSMQLAIVMLGEGDSDRAEVTAI